MKKSPVRTGYGYDTLQHGQVLSSSHFRHQAPPHMQSRQRSQRRKKELFVEKAVLQFCINDRFHAIMYLFLDLPTCICTNYFVSCLSARPTAYLSHVCAWVMTRAKKVIRLYATNMQRIYTEYATKTGIEPTEARGIYSFFLISYMC